MDNCLPVPWKTPDSFRLDNSGYAVDNFVERLWKRSLNHRGGP